MKTLGIKSNFLAIEESVSRFSSRPSWAAAPHPDSAIAMHATAGLIQRITALNLFLHDIYHEQNVLRAGVIPPDQIYNNAQYRPDMLGVNVPRDIYARPASSFGAEFIRLVRHLLVLERDNDLHLFEGLPAKWLPPGGVLRLQDISTEFGPMSLGDQRDNYHEESGAKVDVK